VCGWDTWHSFSVAGAGAAAAAGAPKVARGTARLQQCLLCPVEAYMCVHVHVVCRMSHLARIILTAACCTDCHVLLLQSLLGVRFPCRRCESGRQRWGLPLRLL